MPTKVDLLLECYELTQYYDFSDDIQAAIENDYIENKHLYNDKTFKYVMAWIMIAPYASPIFILDKVRQFNELNCSAD